MIPRYLVAAERAVELAVLYETRVRNARLVDVQAGLDLRTREFLQSRGVACERVPSADFLSYAPAQDRLIEVKGRGGRGSIEVIDRQLDTMKLAGSLAWLYVVFETTQPFPASLYLISNPGSLPWTQTQAATRTPDQYRGVRHMAKFEYDLDPSDPRVEEADLSTLVLPSWAGSRRD